MGENEDQEIARLYNTVSNSYDELYSQEQNLKHKAIMESLGSEKFKLLIDVGCGTGTFLRARDQIYEYAVGIDLSIDMLREANKTGSERIDLVQATARLLPIKDEVADGLVSVSTMKADSALPLVLDEISRVCRVGGILALSIFQSDSDGTPAMLSASKQSKLSDRERLYTLHLNRRLSKDTSL